MPTAAASGSTCARCTATLEVFGSLSGAGVGAAGGAGRRDPRPAAGLGWLVVSTPAGRGRAADRPRAAGGVPLRRRDACAASPATRWPRRSSPTTCCWSGGRSSTTARAELSRAASRSRTRWSASARAALRAERARHHRRAPAPGWWRGARTAGRASSSTSAASARGSAPLLPAGFYYKTFIHPRAAWKHLFEPVIRRSAGLGAGAGGRGPRQLRVRLRHGRRAGRRRRRRRARRGPRGGRERARG